MGHANGEFNRIEDKFIAPLPCFIELMQTLHDHMEPSYLYEGTLFTLIESLYFDSPELDFFHHHIQGHSIRHKLRTRRYAPNGKWNNGPVLLELKSKIDRKSHKTRFVIDTSNFHRLLNGKKLEMNEQLKSLNTTLFPGVLFERLYEVNLLIEQFKLRPSISVNYKRYAFEKDDLRITVDSQIDIFLKQTIGAKQEKILSSHQLKSKLDRIKSKYLPHTHCVIEVKHQGEIPRWVLELFAQLKVEKTSFSKYCWAIAHQRSLLAEEPLSSSNEALAVS